MLAHLERHHRDPSFPFDASRLRPADFAGSFAAIDGFHDTSDFDLLYLMNLWLAYGKELPVGLRQAIERRVLGFKYWYTEPTPKGVIDNCRRRLALYDKAKAPPKET